jgi:hypothetical protein
MIDKHGKTNMRILSNFCYERAKGEKQKLNKEKKEGKRKK